MAYCILRTEKLKSAGEVGSSMAHNYRAMKVDNADASKSKYNHHYYKSRDTKEKAMAHYRSLLPEKHRKDAVQCIELMITASPEYFENGGRMGYFNDARKWLMEHFGAKNIVSAGIHMDEKTPHMYAYVVPLKDGKLNAKNWLGGRKKLSEMQTDFANKVGKKYGLERGVKGSKAEHTSIKKYYSAINEAAKAKPVEAPSKGELSKALIGQSDVIHDLVSKANQVAPLAVENARLKAQTNRESKVIEAAKSKAKKALLEAQETKKKADETNAQATANAERFSPENMTKMMDRQIEKAAKKIQFEYDEKAATLQQMLDAANDEARKAKSELAALNEQYKSLLAQNAEMKQELSDALDELAEYKPSNSLKI